MINREWQKVKVITFVDSVDAYGQKRQSGSAERDSEMVLKIYSQNNTADPRYVEVTNIGITKDTTIQPGEQVKVNNVVYNVLYIIPSSRLYQVLLKRV